MESFGYYSFSDTLSTGLDKCSVSSSEMPLMINCAGHFTSKIPFTTDSKHGRLDCYLIHINSGVLEFHSDSSVISATAGNVIFIPSSTGYKYSYSGGEPLSYFWVHFTGSEAEKRLGEYSLQFFPTVYETEPENHIMQRFQSIFDSFAKQDAYCARELSALLDRLLITVARSVTRLENRQTALIRSLKYIGTHYNSDIKISELASIEHLSISRYNTLFKAQIGIPPTKYILRLRMSSAADLLHSTDISVKQIGMMCGYSDPHFFSKTFKSYFGVSPDTYRKNINSGC